MKNKVDLIIKLVITAAIITVLVILALPALESRGVISKNTSVQQMPASNQRPSGPPSEQLDASNKQPIEGQKQDDSNVGMMRGKTESSSTRAQAVNAAAAVRGTVSDFIKVNGDVVVDAEVDIFPDVSGKVVSCNLEVGDWVDKGQTVAVVDPSMPGQNFSESEVYSTISGTVLTVNVRVGDKVTSNTAVITIGDLSKLKLKTYIPEKYTGNLRIGLPAEVSFAAFPETNFDASVSTIAPVLDPASRTVEVELELENSSEKIKSGMFASIRLVTDQVENVVTVPASAVFEYYGDNTVFVIKEDSTVERKNIDIGMSTVELIEIKSGLDEGDIVVTAGQSLLKDGSKVRIAEDIQE
ncbi:MAG: efflux RND transporter periplasmic adaptor subunit [Spirochaetales bacterium]|uniref:Efflux RND transporter periplasmic adaptor subunit n=1 Tax=Candidatus Thalassospirochaeta sargassi TaxID=3119039 RepID=A0AAJ1MMQ7_9SPIO|nr:efflux RND transporter periplasmic adaptor subunit [Spirochaetales bacterium]